MGLPITTMVQGLATLAFDLASDVVLSLVYVNHNAVNYDPATGLVLLNPDTLASAPVDAIMGKYSLKETDGQRIRAGDERVLVKASELAGIVPTVDDFLAALGDNLIPEETQYSGGAYILIGLTIGALYHYTRDANGGHIQNVAEEVIIDETGFFVAPATDVTLIGEAFAVISAFVKPVASRRLVMDIGIDPTGTLYTFQTRKAAT